MKKFLALFFSFIFFLSACTSQKEKNESYCKSKKTICSKQEHLTMSVLWYQKSAEMKAIYYQTYYLAKLALDKNIVESQSEKKKAIVLDIDETILDNSPFSVKCIETGKAYTPKFWKEWSDLAKANILAGAKDFLNYAKEKNVNIFYVSNRKVNELESTIKNLKKYDLPNVDKKYIFLKEETSSKLERRNLILENYEILLFVGDNLTDFSEIYENRDKNLAIDLVEKDKNQFGKKWIILPNPIYGDWENAIYDNSFKLSEEEKNKKRKENLISY